jgi:polyphenol oxidase
MTPPSLRSALLSKVAGVRHCFFTRGGGVSTGLYESLNTGLGSGDDPASVLENRARVAAAFGPGAQALNTCFQVHSAQVIVCDAPFGSERPSADGLVTAMPGLICGALSADCAPVLIADGEARIVAAVHAGWRGALAGVVGRGVEAMEELGAKAERMVAAVGPCIGPASYEVGEDLEAQFFAGAPGSERFFEPGVSPGKRLFDLPGFVLDRLAAAGVVASEWIGRDTVADEPDFFSNRRAVKRGEKDYGRLISAIMLEG